ncbi:MAG: glycoside hydrolase family 88 protein [Alphaproteobacteria bacterium]|nr:glycoside hydrolase family 88 protein [Alphaproteobacteria bacterium]
MTLPDYFDRFAEGYQPYKGASWCYEDGCIYRGLELLSASTGEARWMAHLHRLADRQIGPDGALLGYEPLEYNIDHILSGRALFALHRDTGEDRYLLAADRLFSQLQTHPRLPAGNYWHKQRYPHQVWLDGLYMGLPFQIEYGQVTGKPGLIVDALQQFATALALTSAPGGLFVHGYDDARAQTWADPLTGKSQAVWARAVGWLAMALVDALALLPMDEGNATLRLRLACLLDAIIARQTGTGLWMQVLDAPDLEGNYEETSASAMFAYALLRGARLGLAPGSDTVCLAAAGRRAYDAIRDFKLETGADGIARLGGIVHVAGLGGFEGRYRDGSPGYYVSEPVVFDDAKGVGPLMMAHSEVVIAGENTGNGLWGRKLS